MGRLMGGLGAADGGEKWDQARRRRREGLGGFVGVAGGGWGVGGRATEGGLGEGEVALASKRKLQWNFCAMQTLALHNFSFAQL